MHKLDCGCESSTSAREHVYVDEGKLFFYDPEYSDYDYIKINFCPFCGGNYKERI